MSTKALGAKCVVCACVYTCTLYNCTCCLQSNNQQLNITIRLPSATNIFCVFVNAVIQLALLDFFKFSSPPPILILTSKILAYPQWAVYVNGTQWNESNTQYIYLLFTLTMFNLQHLECVRVGMYVVWIFACAHTHLFGCSVWVLCRHSYSDK